ncbi:hypothetical protein H2200_002485 [Cladophialophora chaetospira]|uniref:F-box domain-containing protein n=1 Tax=Cladophialophora chaetospira TaxID=386627 RepID=A0AA39CN36_9EURO|nr:hypothetical protein H2200_002485 [Cladophialophora chaetospira]
MAPASLLTLPAEIRLRIYKFVLPELHLDVSSPTNCQTNLLTLNPGLTFSLVSRQTYREARPLVDNSPVVLSNLASQSIEWLPNWVIACAEEVRPQLSSEFAWMSHYVGRVLTTGVATSPPIWERFPKLRHIELPSTKSSHGSAQYPVSLLPLIQQWLLVDAMSGKTNITGLLHHFNQPDSRLPNVTSQSVKEFNSVILQRQLKLTSGYWFGIGGRFHYGTCVSTEWFKATVVWDKTGVEIKELPNIRHNWWSAAIGQKGSKFGLDLYVCERNYRIGWPKMSLTHQKTVCGPSQQLTT